MAKRIWLIAFITICLCLFICGAVADVLTIPEDVTVIDEMAFYGDTNLDEVVLPEGIKSIGKKAFADSSIKRINLPASLRSISIDAFQNCKGITVTAEEGSSSYEWAVEHGYLPGPLGLATIHVPDNIQAGEDFQVSIDPVEGATWYYGWLDGYIGNGYGCELNFSDNLIAYISGSEMYPGTYLVTVTANDTINDFSTESYIEVEITGKRPESPKVEATDHIVKPNEQYGLTIDTTGADQIHYEIHNNGYGHHYYRSVSEDTTTLWFTNSQIDAYSYSFTVRKNGIWSEWTDFITVLVVNNPNDPTAPSGPPEVIISPEEPIAGKDLIIRVEPQEGVSYYYRDIAFENGGGSLTDFSSDFTSLVNGYDVTAGLCTLYVYANPIIWDGNEYRTVKNFQIMGTRPDAPMMTINRSNGTTRDTYFITASTANIATIHCELDYNGGGSIYDINTEGEETKIILNVNDPGNYYFHAVALNKDGIWTEWIEPFIFTVNEYATPTNLQAN